jgi:multidrug efflux pump subunit AcrA (membrane-fusion protein)
VTAGEAARLEPGMPARVSFRDLGGASFEATLQSVGRVAESSDGTYEIELWLSASDVAMRDGLVAQIELADSKQGASLLAPRAAILRRDGHPEVFVVTNEKGADVVRARRLRTGRSDGEWIEILDGLEEGERVVWDGHFALEDGSTVVIDGAPTPISAVAASK